MSKFEAFGTNKESGNPANPPGRYCDRDQAGPDYFRLFVQSRQAIEVSPSTLEFYRIKLGRFASQVNMVEARPEEIEQFLLQFKNPGNRHAYFRAVRTFYRWREQRFGLPNPMKSLRAPRLGKLIMPSLTLQQVFILLEAVPEVRNKAIIALFTESGLRLTELVNIKLRDIDWSSRLIRVIGKGRKERLAPFGEITEDYLREWLSHCQAEANIWGLNEWGVISMLRRLEAATGLKCNPHVFRRTFACLQRRAGVDVMTIMILGGWSSLQMVQLYTRSFSFTDSLRFYKPPLGRERTLPEK